MAPTGEITSWQTREQSRAARSRASRVTAAMPGLRERDGTPGSWREADRRSGDSGMDSDSLRTCDWEGRQAVPRHRLGRRWEAVLCRHDARVRAGTAPIRSHADTPAATQAYDCLRPGATVHRKLPVEPTRRGRPSATTSTGSRYQDIIDAARSPWRGTR